MNRPRKVFGRIRFTARSKDRNQKEFTVELTNKACTCARNVTGADLGCR